MYPTHLTVLWTCWLSCNGRNGLTDPLKNFSVSAKWSQKTISTTISLSDGNKYIRSVNGYASLFVGKREYFKMNLYTIFKIWVSWNVDIRPNIWFVLFHKSEPESLVRSHRKINFVCLWFEISYHLPSFEFRRLDLWIISFHLSSL